MTEDGFLAMLFEKLPPGSREVAVPAGDDCAGIALADGRVLLVAADQVIGDRHYNQTGPDRTPPEQAGRKLLARNVSDIGAMGGTPTQCVICAAFGPDVDENWMVRFHDGIIDFARELGIAVIGGDVARAPHDTVCSLTILGIVPAAELVLRRGASEGDVLLVTGTFGDSLSTGHHLSFPTRWREGRWLAANRHAKAMIDVSDGLLLDAARLCRASGIGLMLDLDAVPLRIPGSNPARACADGEDYELLVAVRPDRVNHVLAEWPFPDVPLTQAGRFAPTPEHAVVDSAGRALKADGYDHFVA